MAQAQHDPRTSSQATHERAMNEVSDVLLNVEHALARTRKAVKRLGDSPEENNARLALTDAQAALERTRTRLQRDGYFNTDALRLV